MLHKSAINRYTSWYHQIPKTQLTEIIKDQKEGGELVETRIVENATNELIGGKDIPNGDYTVGDYLVTIVEGKVANVTR